MVLENTDKKAAIFRRSVVAQKKGLILERLEEYVKENEDMTLKKAFQEFGVSIFTISYWLKILGYSYKKKTFPMWKQMKKSEVSIKNRSKI